MSGSLLEMIIEYTHLFQDVELSAAIQRLRNNPEELQRFLQNQQENVYRDITKQKDESFTKVYGDLERAGESQRASMMFGVRNTQLDRITQDVLNKQESSSLAVTADNDLAKRKYEMNEWAVNNKKETLFIYSQLFIILCASCVLVYLWKKGIMGLGLFIGIELILVLIFIFTIVYRSQYTDTLRNRHFWNRRQFKQDKAGIKIPIPNGCINPVDMYNTARADVQNVGAALGDSVIAATPGVFGKSNVVSSAVSAGAAAPSPATAAMVTSSPAKIQ
jgi:hypothetical protein